MSESEFASPVGLARRTTDKLEICNALWTGGELPAFSAACLSSFAEVGHQVRLHVYDVPKGVPSGVELVDASSFVPADRIVRHHKTGSLALFSNLYRYELMAREQGLWIDSDVLCLRPLRALSDYVFGRESDSRLNGAILKLPAGSPMLADLRAIFTTPRWSAPWNDKKRRFRDAVYYRVRKDYGISKMSWGSAGPRAITYFANKHNVAVRAVAPDVFYPISVRRAGDLLRPDFPVEDLVTPDTLCIHLWADVIGKEIKTGIPRKSFIADVVEGRWRARLADAVSPALA